MNQRIFFESSVRLAISALLLAGSGNVPRIQAETAGGAVTIEATFPGGNIAVEANQGSEVQLAPDLRGDSPWFYWCFEATATKAGRVRFVFPEKVVGFVNGAIGLQGPAVSQNRGASWKWMGAANVQGRAFFYDFAPAERVRFAVALPYVQSDLDAFLAKHAGNQHLRTAILIKSRRGRDVELLQIGEPGEGKQAVMATGRHHAAETMASYVLEGFLTAAMSASPAGEKFRARHVLYAVPFVDKDGVEAGDQGKNRKPHDHNRDYIEASIYPEVQAIMKLVTEKHVQFGLDFHCPTLVMPDHQVMYFAGVKGHPQFNFQNVTEFAAWIKKGLPPGAPAGPLVWLRDEKDPPATSARFFGRLPGAVMSATLEFPFAPPGKATDAASCRRYGEAILAAWVETHFRASAATPEQ